MPAGPAAKTTAEAIAEQTQLAEAHAAKGELFTAIAACKRILELDPKHTDTQARLAEIYARKKADAAGSEAPAFPLFSDLPKNAFIQLVEEMRMRELAPGETAIREGDQGDAMFIVAQGQVKVTKTAESGGEVVLARLGGGTFFGEMALLSESPRSASVVALEETLLLQISRKVLDDVVKEFPSVKNVLLRFYRQRLLATLMATSPIFKPLPADDRKALIEKFKAREMGSNETVLAEGKAADGLYMLLSGRLEVAKAGAKKQVLAHLKEGDVFGEMSLLSQQPASATIRTLRKSVVLLLPRKTFDEVVAAHPQLLQHIKTLSAERDKTNEAIMKGQLRFSEEEGLVLM